MENVKACIKEILDGFKSGDCFDSHTVIEELKEKYYSAYTQDFSKDWTEAQYHGRIAQCIGGFSGIVESGTKSKQLGKIKSHNINGNISKCELWRKR